MSFIDAHDFPVDLVLRVLRKGRKTGSTRQNLDAGDTDSQPQDPAPVLTL